MRLFISILTTCLFISCTKDSKDACEEWQVTYFQGDSQRKTLTNEYTPYNKNESYCGKAKDTISVGKVVVISQVSANRFNYKTFVVKK